MTKIRNPKTVYDLEKRTFQFAKVVSLFVKTLPKLQVLPGQRLVIGFWKLRFNCYLGFVIWNLKGWVHIFT